MKKIKAAIMADNIPFHDGDIIEYVYGKELPSLIDSMTDLYPVRITSKNLDEELPGLADTEVIFSSWGIPPLTSWQLDKMPRLKVVFYAGGSSKAFAPKLLERGITVCSAVQANAIPVAEFCLAQILLSCKNAYQNSRLCRNGPWNYTEMATGPGVYGETIALIGIGAISRHLLKLLKPFSLRIIAVSGYLSDNPDAARALGIDQIVSMEEAFRRAHVVSNHLPDREDNKGVMMKEHFASMRPRATFINTGRGAQVDESGMIEVLKMRPDLTALLDVQHPEPPAPGSELYSLPNVHLTSHIAGSINNEVRRMGDFMFEDFLRYMDDKPLKYAVESENIAAMA